MNDYDWIIEILNREINIELDCLKVTKGLLKKTWNPFKRRQLKQSLRMFSSHIAAIKHVIYKIKKEIAH